MINAALLSKIDCQKLALGIMSYLHDKCSFPVVFPEEAYEVMRKFFLKKGFIDYFSPTRLPNKLQYNEFFWPAIQCIMTGPWSYPAVLNSFQEHIRNIIPTGVIQAINEDNQCKVNEIELNTQVITFGSKLLEEETYEEIPILADMCEDYGYMDYVNHFRSNELVHTLTCPFLQSIWRA